MWQLQPGLGRRASSFDLLALAWSALVALALFWLFGERGYDDPYITYRYAATLARGAGFVYNEGQRVLSTTTPLYTMILAAAHLAGADIPLAGNAISCASLALGGLAFWRLGATWRTPAAGLVGLLLYPLAPLLLPTLGGETALYNALVLFGFLAYAHGRYVQTAALLALATLTRADGALAAAVVAVDYLIRADYRNLVPAFDDGRPTIDDRSSSIVDRLSSTKPQSNIWLALFRAKVKQPPWRAAVVYVTLLAPWFLFAWAYFGAPLPVTLAAKQRQGMMAISQSFLAGLLQQGGYYWSYPLYRPHFALAAVGLIYGLARERRWLLIPAWSLLYVTAYAALGVTSYFWYYGPVAPGLVALVGLGAAAVHHLARRHTGRSWARAIAALLGLALLMPEALTLNYAIGHPYDARLSIYRAAGEWLREHIPSGASVGALEVGIVGYYAERPMIDFAGLLEPEVAARLGPATTYEDAARWAIQRYKPGYVLLQQGMFPTLERDPLLVGRCAPVKRFEKGEYVFPLVVYACT